MLVLNFPRTFPKFNQLDQLGPGSSENARGGEGGSEIPLDKTKTVDKFFLHGSLHKEKIGKNERHNPETGGMLHLAEACRTWTCRESGRVNHDETALWHLEYTNGTSETVATPCRAWRFSGFTASAKIERRVVPLIFPNFFLFCIIGHHDVASLGPSMVYRQ
jgi:hypothetical protein